MDTREYLSARIAATRPSMPWKPGTPAEMRSWQTRLRQQVRKLIGGCSGPRSPLNAATHEVKALEGYRRETVRFESRPGFEVFAYLLVPERAAAPSPAILCLPGHGRGVDSIVGIAPDGSQRPLDRPDEYQKDFALQCVRNGYIALAIEQMSFGHRRDRQARQAGRDASSCTRDSTALLQLGETMTGWRVWDAMRSLDYLETRLEVDKRRLGVMGISGGGLTTLFTACLDQRVRAAVVSGYFNTFAGSILAVDHCVDNYVPGLLTVTEMPDMAGLVAPRALFAESGTEDPIFPLPTFRAAVRRLQDIYRAFGAPEMFAYEEFPGDHQFHGVQAFKFLDAHLRGMKRA